jgi:hypothetical protein
MDCTTNTEQQKGEEAVVPCYSLLENLPPDLIRSILSYLYFEDLDSIQFVSHCMNNAIRWVHHVYMTEQSLRTIWQRNQNTKALEGTTSLLQCHSPTWHLTLPPQQPHPSQILPKRLETPTFACDSRNMTPSGFRSFLRRYDSLNVLHLYGLACVGDELFSILNESPSAKTLQRIELHGCCLSYWCRTSLELTNLTHLTIMGGSIRVSLGSFLWTCANTKDDKDDDGLYKKNPTSRLKSLAIGQCSSLRDECVREICHQLESTLESLSLHQCLRIKNPAIQVSKLHSLQLMGCFALSDLPMFHCPLLTSLSLSFCFRLEGDVIQTVVDSLHFLENLILLKCPRLVRLQISSSTLRTLNVSLCNELHTLRLNCPKLDTLDTSSCTSLTYLSLRSNSMEELQLGMLPSLVNASVTSSSLQRLWLGGCGSLIDANIRCPNLTHLDICGTPLTSEPFLTISPKVCIRKNPLQGVAAGC